MYHLMVLSITTAGFDKMEQISRNFMWGSNKIGTHKKALIPWECITQDKGKGGLGIPPLKEHAQALKMRHTIKLLTNQDIDWVRMVQELTSCSLRTGPNKKEQKGWSIAEALLLCGELCIKGSPTLRSLVTGW